MEAPSILSFHSYYKALCNSLYPLTNLSSTLCVSFSKGNLKELSLVIFTYVNRLLSLGAYAEVCSHQPVHFCISDGLCRNHLPLRVGVQFQGLDGYLSTGSSQTSCPIPRLKSRRGRSPSIHQISPWAYPLPCLYLQMNETPNSVTSVSGKDSNLLYWFTRLHLPTNGWNVEGAFLRINDTV